MALAIRLPNSLYRDSGAHEEVDWYVIYCCVAADSGDLLSRGEELNPIPPQTVN